MPLEPQASHGSPLSEVPPPMPEFDPSVQPTSSRPSPSSSTPGDTGGTSGADVQAEEEQPKEALPEFDSRYVDEFEGLMYLGALVDDFEWMGHKFRIRTAKTDELAEAALLVKPYQGTDVEMKVYQVAVVAASVLSVDGRPLPAPISSDPADTALSNRFRYVMSNWYGPTIDAVYQRYYELELRARQVLEAMGNRSG